MNCDRIAPFYRFLEYGSFGTAMRSTRYRFLSECRDAERVLLLGDGDGRFLARFVRENSNAIVDSVDNSSQMLRLAERRLKGHGRSRTRFHHLDVRYDDLPSRDYDLVVTNFFLDCFSPEELTAIVQKISDRSRQDAAWLVSEFCEPPDRGWKRWRARAWVGGLYVAFRFLSGIEANHLPDYPQLLSSAGFRLTQSHSTSAGLLVSELWKRGMTCKISLQTEKAR